MFGFFKKKESPKQEKAEEVPILTEEERVKLLMQISDDQQVLQTLAESDDKAEIYERVGLAFAELQDVDNAIESLEKSLECKLSMGEGYKKLMSLYNAKRAIAAKNRDNDGIDYYMSKMDDMRNIAKKLTLSR